MKDYTNMSDRELLQTTKSLAKKKKRLTEVDKAWAQGFYCAIAMLIQKQGTPDTYARELFHEGLSGGIKELKRHEVDAQDLSVFQEHISSLR